ncbi:AAA family ATPase [Dysgonomonas sp. BGC7]|uniref:AAA family ATPase n=1 Tax=Dysgonomonas sp. BGC7 TaxID=1658008 RepID=UPI0006811B58|nr:AAA family ATPase [Dysgonomonas sp. BGC7]MBD8387791.1 AAA family ATPase [Dysgonomonas sp. BGC7]
MGLLYLYIEDDGKNIKDCEFNFSPEFTFSFDRKGKIISITYKDNYIPNFWGVENITNITAVIGRNGAGKSNLFNYLVNNITFSNTSSIYIFKKDDEVQVFADDNIKINALIKEKITIITSTNDIIHENLIHPIIYYSSSFFQEIYLDEFRNKSSVNLSLKSLLNIAMQNHSIFGTDAGSYMFSNGKMISLGGALYYYKYESTLRHINLINAYPQLNIEDINIPKLCRIQTIRPTFNRKVKQSKQLLTKVEKYGQLFLNSYTTEKEREDNYKAFWYQALFFELYTYCLDMGFEQEAESFINAEKALHYRTFTYLFYNNISLINNDTKEINDLFLKLDIILDNIHTKPEQNLSESILSIKDAQEVLTVYSLLLFKFYKNIADKYSYRETSRKELYFEQCFKVAWEYPLSSGEESYLDFFANLHYAKSQINNDAKRLTIILDEPELSLHPELQRKFINILISICHIVFSNFELQILLASHSPILLSDFPKNNVIFLDKNEDGTCRVVDSISRDNTFGANIHTLYKNSFFIKGLPIGEFAKKKINKLFDELENGQIRSTTLKEIQLVGEPLLKDQLMKLYKYCEGIPENMNKRIAELEREIETLKKRIDDQN